MDNENDTVTTEDFNDAIRLMTAERVRQYYVRNRETILKRRHEAYFKKKHLRKIPERQVYSHVKYLKPIVEDGP